MYARLLKRLAGESVMVMRTHYCHRDANFDNPWVVATPVNLDAT
jgi:hypothetical protein